jgi:leucyl aminopeptidase
MPALSLSARNIVDNARTATQCAILPIFQGVRLSAEAREIDQACNGVIKNALKLGDFEGKSGQSLLLPGTGRIKRILLLGCGERDKFDRDAVRALAAKLYTSFSSLSATEATLHTLSLGLKKADHPWALDYIARHLNVANYRYSETVSKPRKPLKLRKIVVNVGDKISVNAANKALRAGKLTALGINDAKELANLPGNVCTPNYLASHARKLSRKHKKLSVSILDEKKMRELGMNALLSVSAGSDQPAKLIVMQYRGGKAGDAPQVLVGKGITFDSGGISLKPGAKMDEMKYDMGGAASVFGTMRSVVELGLPLNVIGIVAAAENMPSGTATKPGDVITSMAGKTIEVLNTDAEGRLVLCDALTYAQRYKPAAIVDIATLTGACVVALGAHATGLFSNNDKLAEQLIGAGEESHDRAWRMPLWKDYQKQLNSNFADIANIGGPGGGSITAACFLSRFTEDQTWAHLDIAGSAWNSAPKGATGRPVALLLRYLMNQAGL